VCGQAETNSLIRKAAQKLEECPKEEGSDSSFFSMGSAESNSDDESLVSISDILERNGTAFKNVFGSFYGEKNESESESEGAGGMTTLAMKRHSAPAHLSLHTSLNTSLERNIFQRGMHKIEKRITSLQKLMLAVVMRVLTTRRRGGRRRSGGKQRRGSKTPLARGRV